MSKIVNRFFLAGDKFMPEMYLRPTRFTYIAFGPFRKSKEIIRKAKKQKIQDIFIKTN